MVALVALSGTGAWAASQITGAQIGNGQGVALPGAASRFGFRIVGPQDSSTASVNGTWAYTAP